MRFLPAGLLLLLLAPAPAGEHPRLRRRAGLLGVVFFGVGTWLANQGVARTTAAHASLIVGSIPALTAGLAWLVLRERLSARLVVALALSGSASRPVRPGSTSTSRPRPGPGPCSLGELLPPATLAGGVLMVAATLGASRSPASRSATRPGSPLPGSD